MRGLRKSKKIKRWGEQLGQLQLRCLPYGERRLVRRRIVSVSDALSSVGGREFYREKLPDVPFPEITSYGIGSKGKTLAAPVYDGYLTRLDNIVVHGGSNFLLGPAGEAINDVAADPDWSKWVFFATNQS